MKLSHYEVRAGLGLTRKIFRFDDVEDAMCFAQLAFDGCNGDEVITISLIPKEPAAPEVTHLDVVTE